MYSAEKKDGNRGLKMRTALAGLSASVAVQLLGIPGAQAHDGFSTTYNHHIMPREFEIMMMTDYTSPADIKREEDGQGDYFSQMFEIEYAPSDQLAFEFMIEAFQDIETGDSEFTGFRWEARYRLFKDDVFLNPMVYAEYEDLSVNTRYKMEVSGWRKAPYEEAVGAEASRERILETRLVLSQDIGAHNVAFNWINESDLSSGTTAFGYSLGFLYRVSRDEAVEQPKGAAAMAHCLAGWSLIRPASLAFELYGGLGDTRKFGLVPSRQEHYFQPTINFDVGENQMLSFGLGIGLTETSDHMVRLNWGIML